MKLNYILFAVALIFFACEQKPLPGKVKKLPILGEREFINGDSVFHTIPDFTFINQDSVIITNKTFENKIYVVDFFFTSCPTICPTVKKNAVRIYDKFKTENRVSLLSHSIDTKYDSVPVLKKYSAALEINDDKWHFVTGEKDHIYDMADQYFIAAKEDPDAEGGYDHSGRLILVDENRMVRAFCNGTEAEEVDRFMLEIQQLLDEKK